MYFMTSKKIISWIEDRFLIEDWIADIDICYTNVVSCLGKQTNTNLHDEECWNDFMYNLYIYKISFVSEKNHIYWTYI